MDDKNSSNPTPWLNNQENLPETSQPQPEAGQTFAPQKQEPTASEQPNEKTPPKVQNEQSQTPENDEIPDYLKGADAPPPVGQSVHPAGTYQAKPGEIAQASSGGVGVVENSAMNTVSMKTKKPLWLKLFLGAASLIIVVSLGFVAFSLLSGPDTQNGNVDEELKSDTAILLTALNQYAEDNEGVYPQMQLTVMREFAADYLPENFTDPRTERAYQLVTDKPALNSEIQYLPYGQCGENGTITAAETADKIALRVYLSDGTLHCIDNS